MGETRIDTEYDATATVQQSRSITTGDRVVELGLEVCDEGTYATLSLAAAKQLLATLAIEIAKAELAGEG